ncbi:hypothetical protein [Lysobacter panacisoli]|uniref:Uncharacterized protein n=1 Tax=Lysobacter panacisoli TaxID=1255263 RepID=A0ABP9LNB8_9GAMM|nr:hypothetical protein [Lysobacter panacisoli]
MSRPDHEPLSPEERALAERLARLGPHDGPSPALDAKILAAAHAAVAPKRRRRWLGLTAIPGSLTTGAGMAAALVVVVGVVWQLRPSSPTPQVPREEGDMGYVSAEILERAPPAPAPPPPPMEAAKPARALQAPGVARAPARKQEAPAAASIAHDDHYVDEAIVHAPATVAADTAATGAAAPAPYASPVFAPTPSPAFAPPPPAPVAQAAAEAEMDAREDMARRQVSAESASRDRSEAAAAASAKRAAVASESASPALDRIEVTGSSLAGVPVDEDLELPPDEWIERIRARRDDGDLDGARESLKRLREVHPRVRVPHDLRALAAPAAR